MKNIAKKYPHQKKQVPYRFTAISPNDSRYAEKTLLEIRRYITHKYVPKHSWAHTQYDIAKYCDSTDILSIMSEIEVIEYSGITPSAAIANYLNKRLSSLLQ